MRVYFDNASTTPLLHEVKETMISVINDEHGNPSSIHLPGRKSRTIVENARRQIAEGLNASTGEIFFTSGATEANNMVLSRAMIDLRIRRIITTNIEHPCITNTIAELPDTMEIVVLEVNQDGHLDYESVEKLVSQSDKKTLVSIMHVNNEIGVINDMAVLSDICQKQGALLHMDAAQSVGKLRIDLTQTPMAFLSAAAHKFHGPKGCGFLYINGDNMIKPLITGGGQERGLRSGTENIYGIAGMAKALELSINELDNRAKIIAELKEYFVKRLTSELQDIQINGAEPKVSNILSVSFPESPRSEMMMMNLDISGVCASGGSACSSGVENASPVLNAIGHDPSRKTIRFSFSHLNTHEEVDYVMDQLKSITSVSV